MIKLEFRLDPAAFHFRGEVANLAVGEWNAFVDFERRARKRKRERMVGTPEKRAGNGLMVLWRGGSAKGYNGRRGAGTPRRIEEGTRWRRQFWKG